MKKLAFGFFFVVLALFISLFQLYINFFASCATAKSFWYLVPIPGRCITINLTQ